MRSSNSQARNRAFVLIGLSSALLIAVFLSPFASPHPDGLNRVAEDLGFADKAPAETPAHKLPFANLFDGYALKGVPEGLSTPLAGLVGTLVTFGVALAAGKLLVKGSSADRPLPPSDRDHPAL